MLSTTVTATASRNTLPDPRGQRHEQRERRGAGRDPDRQEQIHEQREVQQLLDRRRPFDEREIGSGVLEHHRLVDHRQFEVRRRIVHRDASRFGDDDDEEAGEGEQIARMERDAVLEDAPHEPAEDSAIRRRAPT